MSNDDPPTTLRGVVLRAIDRQGVDGGRELARVSESKKAKLSHGTINGLLGGTYKNRPSDALLQKLATLAEMEVPEVRAAASVPNPGSPFAEDLPDGADYITGPSRKILIDTIRLFAQQSRRTAELEAELEELRNDVDRSAANTDGDDEAGGVVIDLPKPPPSDDEEGRAAHDDEDDRPNDPED